MSYKRFGNFYKYIWPFFISIIVTGLCYLIMFLIPFNNLTNWVNHFVHAPTNFLFGEEKGILIKSFWGFDIGNWFEGLFANKEALKLLFLPLIDFCN